jgi:large subunit ribosomal protein L4
MAETKDDKKKAAAAAKPAAKKATAAKAAAPVKRAVPRPAKRVVAPAPERPREERPAPAAATAAPKPKRQPRPLPTAPAGEMPLISGAGDVGSLPLPEWLRDGTERKGVLFQALEVAASNAHLGTAATKNRARVAGGGAKPWRQKGTGRARQGSTRAPHWRHGGVVFGPNGRRYARRIPEKMRREAFLQALAQRAGSGRLFVYDELRFAEERPRTREVVEWLGRLGDTGKTLLVTPQVDAATARAAANVREVSFRSVGALRTADVLSHETLVVRRDALDALKARVAIAGGAA